MSDRKQALQDLLAKIEAGKWDCNFPNKGMAGLRSAARYRLAAKAYDGSLDAAKALHEAVLPEFEYGYDGSLAWVKLPGLRTSYRHDSRGDYTARAWLCAILKALISQELTND